MKEENDSEISWGGATPEMARRDTNQRKRRWRMYALGLVTLLFVVIVVAAVVAANADTTNKDSKQGVNESPKDGGDDDDSSSTLTDDTTKDDATTSAGSTIPFQGDATFTSTRTTPTASLKDINQPEVIVRQMGNELQGDALEDAFGSSVALNRNDGTVLAVGAMYGADRDGGYNYGYVRIYEWKNEKWNARGDIIEGDRPMWSLGRSVDLSADGSILAVTFAEIIATNGFVGARIFLWNGSQWVRRGQDIQEPDMSHFSQIRLSADGSRVALGMHWGPTTQAKAGRVQVYEYRQDSTMSAEGTWELMGDETFGAAGFDQFGTSLAFSNDGNMFASGSPFSTKANGITYGSVRVFAWLDNKWTQVGQTVEGEDPLSSYGAAVSLAVNDERMVLAVGAPHYENTFGKVYLYQYNPSSMLWEGMGQRVLTGTGGSIFGISVVLSGDGRFFVVGSVGGRKHGGSTAYYALVDGRDGTKTWVPVLGSDIDGEAVRDNWGGSSCHDG